VSYVESVDAQALSITVVRESFQAFFDRMWWQSMEFSKQVSTHLCWHK